MLESIENGWKNGAPATPRIFVLKVRGRDDPTGNAIAWLIVERTEKYISYPGDSLISKASIDISYRQLKARHAYPSAAQGSFSGSYSLTANAVSLTSSLVESSGAVNVDLPGLNGHRIGTFMMSQIVEWVQQWPEATVNEIKLIESQSYESNKERRNRFYERFGIEFDYLDTERKGGTSRSMTVSKLHLVESWRQNITIHTLTDYIATLLFNEQELSIEFTRSESVVRELKVELADAKRRPIRWLLKTIINRYGFKLLIPFSILYILYLAITSHA